MTWKQGLETGSGGGPCSWEQVTGKPEAFPPDAHNHDGQYSQLGHTHAGYATTGHNHDGVYAPIDHTHQGGGSDPWVYLKLSSADFTTSSATAVDITGLGFTPLANTWYEFHGMLLL